MILADLDVKHGHVVTNGVRLHYVEKSYDPKAPVVLLLHGFPECWWSWRHQIEPFAKAGYRVIAPDLRGYNDSEKRGPYDIDTLAGDIAGLAKHFSPDAPVKVVSHDWGGAVAWHFAAMYPELLSQLAVLNCPHPVMLQKALLGGNLRQLQRSWYMFYFQLPWAPERTLTKGHAEGLPGLYRAHAHDRANFSNEELEPLRDAICKPGAATAALEYYRAAFRRTFQRPAPPKLPTINAPTLLLWARDDKALGYDDVVPGTERYAPDLRVELVEQCGHFLQAEQPAIVNERVLAFLAEGKAAQDSASATISS